jgi:hypothetical protein
MQPLVEENIQARVDRMEAIKSKELEVGRIKSQLAREKQYNKQVSINAALRLAKRELAQLKAADLSNE